LEDQVKEGERQEVTAIFPRDKAVRYIGIPVAAALLLLTGGFWAG
jgi:hypothetical protein